MGLYDNIRSKTEDTQTSGERVRQRGDLVPMPEMIGGPAADAVSVPFRDSVTITADNPRTLPVVPEEVVKAHEDMMPDHGPARGASVLRQLVLKMLMKPSDPVDQDRMEDQEQMGNHAQTDELQPSEGM